MEDGETFEGWELVTKVRSDGTRVKYYTNVLGQKFYNKEDLLRNIKDAKARGLSIYDPEFKADNVREKKVAKVRKASSSSSKCDIDKFGSASNGRSKTNSAHKSPIPAKKQKEAVENQQHSEKISSRSFSPDQTTGTGSSAELRTSRRLAGLEPELRHDFAFDRGLEYIIKDNKPKK